ncbi:MAG: glycosyltransferase [Rhodospirillales bacterium]|nr:glycosyltransferase [Rhodospirillales bacterium]
MRFLIMDPGAVAPVGHHFLMNTIYFRELSRRGHDVRVYTHRNCKDVPPDLLPAIPYFSFWPYGATSNDPVDGWLDTWQQGSEIIYRDLRALPERFDTEPVGIIVHSMHHNIFAGICRWIAELPRQGGPTVFLLFGLPSGIKVEGEGIALNYPVATPYRRGFNILRQAEYPRVVLGAPTDIYNQEFNILANGLPVISHPFHFAGDLHDLAVPPRRDGRIRLLYAGDARPDKGFHLLPDILEALLSRHADVEADIQISGFLDAISGSGLIASRLEMLARQTGRVRLRHGYIGMEEYMRMLAEGDVGLLPYSGQHYGSLPSGVQTELLFLGKPTVVPAHTAMEKMINQLGGCGVTFERQEAASCIAAVETLLAEFPLYQTLARRARNIWRASNGNTHLMDFLLDHMARHAANSGG